MSIQNIKKIVKAADILVAYIKAIDELHHNNHEFDHVEERLAKKLKKYQEQMPEVNYFLNTFIKACTDTVDKLASPSE